MAYLSEIKECIEFLLESESGASLVSTVSARTLLTGTHKQKVKTKTVQNYNDVISSSPRPCSCRRGFVSAGLVVSK